MNSNTATTIFDGRATNATPNAIHSREQKLTHNQVAFGRSQTQINNYTPNHDTIKGTNSQVGTFTTQSVAHDRAQMGPKTSQNLLDRNVTRRRADLAEGQHVTLPHSEHMLYP